MMISNKLRACSTTAGGVRYRSSAHSCSTKLALGAFAAVEPRAAIDRLALAAAGFALARLGHRGHRRQNVRKSASAFGRRLSAPHPHWVKRRAASAPS
jgi:hypothetical protein